MPGRRANDSMSLATGSMRGVATRRSHPRDAQAAGHGRHLLFGEVASRSQRVFDRGDDQVLEHLDIFGVDDRWVDGDADQLLLAGDGRTDDAATSRAVDLRGLGPRLVWPQ